MRNPNVFFVGKYMFSGVPEGHKIASLRVIEAACRSGVNTNIITVENAEAINKKSSIMDAFHGDRNNSPFLFSETFHQHNLPLYYLNEITYSTRVIKQLKNLDFDIVHYLNITKEVISVIQTLFRVRRPCIAHLYHSEYAFNRLDFRVRLFTIKIGLFNHILAANKSLARYLTEVLKIEKERVHYVPFPIDTERFRMRNKKKLREKYGLPVDAPIIVYVGAIYPDRGVFVLLDAFKEILNREPNALLFVCHSKLEGDEANYSPIFYKLAESKEFRGHVILEGPSSNIEEIYCLSDIVALPFTQPYWITDPPLVLLEAMACGVPIVTTPVGAMAEIGKDKENLIFSSPSDIKSLTNAVCWTLENSDEARKIGLNARKTIEEEFSMELVGRQLKSLYQETLDLI